MTAERKVHYAQSGGLEIAYEVLGDGPIDIVTLFEWGSSLDIVWDNPRCERFLRRIAEFGRLIRFDVRGTGLSDRVDDLPPLEDWVDDVSAVLAAVGSERACLIGHGHAAQPCLLFAATHPQQTSAVVTVNGFARLRRGPAYPWGFPPEAEARAVRFMRENWGTGRVLAGTSRGPADSRLMEWLAKCERASATSRAAALKHASVFEIDIRDILPTIESPTLVIHSRGNPFANIGHAEYLVDRIAGARYLELPGADYTPFMSQDADQFTDAIEGFLVGAKRPAPSRRSLMTVAFTDIVDSTGKAAQFGDTRWRSLLETHESVSRREVESARGQLIKFTGDGLMATFDGPARAVQCMRAIGEALASVGLPIRAGVHTGEVESLGDDVGGIAVHIAARISALAEAGEILTSSTVRDLVAGSGLEFDDRGEHELKGVPGTWRVLAAR